MTAQAALLPRALPQEPDDENKEQDVEPQPKTGPDGALSAFLEGTPLRMYLRSKPPSTVCIVDPEFSVSAALRLFKSHEISSAPIVGDRCGFVGFLNLADILQELLSLTNVWGLTPENRSEGLQVAGRQLGEKLVKELSFATSDGKLLFKDDDDASLMEVIKHGFFESMHSGQVCHRLAVFRLHARGGNEFADSQEPDLDDAERLDDVACGCSELMQQVRVTNIISLSDLLKYVFTHAPESPAMASMTIEDLGLASKVVMSVPADMPAINAFAAMRAQKVSSVGVVQHDQGGQLVGSLSITDLRRLGTDEYDLLALPALQFIKACRRPDCQKCKRQRPNAWGLHGGETAPPLDVVTCGSGALLESVVSELINRRLHRIYVIDGRRHPVGVLTTSDVLRTIVDRGL